MMKHHTPVVLAMAGLLAVGGLAEAQNAPEAGRSDLSSPVTASPGSPTGSLIGDPCPAFSWGKTAGARSYELAVYRLWQEAEEDEEVLREILPGAALSWTPSLDRCLERGGQYAWTVRAIARQGETGWAPPSFFTVAPGTSAATVEETLAMVRQYLADPGAPAAAKAPASSSRPGSTRSPATQCRYLHGGGVPEYLTAPRRGAQDSR